MNKRRNQPERDAVRAARRMEDKAQLCVTIAGQMFPNATDDVIEAQAVDLMHIPERSLRATLRRYQPVEPLPVPVVCDPPKDVETVKIKNRYQILKNEN